MHVPKDVKAVLLLEQTRVSDMGGELCLAVTLELRCAGGATESGSEDGMGWGPAGLYDTTVMDG